MTGRRLYDKHCDALKKTERYGWRKGEHVLTFPSGKPTAWPFIGPDAQRYWSALAKAVTPKPRKPAPPAEKTIVISEVSDKVIHGINGIRAAFLVDLEKAKAIAAHVRARETSEWRMLVPAAWDSGAVLSECGVTWRTGP